MQEEVRYDYERIEEQLTPLKKSIGWIKRFRRVNHSNCL